MERYEECIKPIYTLPPYKIKTGDDITLPYSALPLLERLEHKALGSHTVSPRPYCIMKNIKKISSCIHHNAAIDQDDNLWIWGASTMAQMENGCYSFDVAQQVEYIPKKKMEKISQVSIGALHTLCLDFDGVLWGWGHNAYGELGCGDIFRKDEPVKIMNQVLCTFANNGQSYAIQNDYTLWGWGDNSENMFPCPYQECTKPIHLFDNAKFICSDGIVGFIIDINSNLYGWGSNTGKVIYKMGCGNFWPPVLLMSGVRQCSLPPDGDLYCLLVTESNELFSVGISDPGAMVNFNTRKARGVEPIKLLDNVQSIRAGHHFSLILSTDGRLFSFGENAFGQCGTGKSTGPLKKPTCIMENVIDMAVGHYHAMALQSNGDLWIWGGEYGR